MSAGDGNSGPVAGFAVPSPATDGGTAAGRPRGYGPGGKAAIRGGVNHPCSAQPTGSPSR